MKMAGGPIACSDCSNTVSHVAFSRDIPGMVEGHVDGREAHRPGNGTLIARQRSRADSMVPRSSPEKYSGDADSRPGRVRQGGSFSLL